MNENDSTNLGACNEIAQTYDDIHVDINIKLRLLSCALNVCEYGPNSGTTLDNCCNYRI